MIYFALIVVCIMMALITIFFALFCYECEGMRPFNRVTAALTGFFLLIFGANFVFFTYDMLCRIGNGQTGLAWYGIIMMGVACLVMLLPLIYAWRVVRKERLAKAQ